MRGKAAGAPVGRLAVGITPAHAGKSHNVCIAQHRNWDHPRTCGEKQYQPCTGNKQLGSPPHMRGKEMYRALLLASLRITPAHAGKSPCQFVHTPIHRGSPPHMRGKVALVNRTKLSNGITPAHAGKRDFRVLHQHLQEDHPRTCGEKGRRNDAADIRAGSPPHMRGKDVLHPDAEACNGITPAHAGKSRLLGNFLPDGRDHPRTCGEKTKKIP